MKAERIIRLYGCVCPSCRGRAAVCINGFDWLDRGAADHALLHAQADLIEHFDRLPHQVQDALNRADVNVCAYCAQIWVNKYGVDKAARLIRDARFVNDTTTTAVTPLHGWRR